MRRLRKWGRSKEGWVSEMIPKMSFEESQISLRQYIFLSQSHSWWHLIAWAWVICLRFSWQGVEKKKGPLLSFDSELGSCLPLFCDSFLLRKVFISWTAKKDNYLYSPASTCILFLILTSPQAAVTWPSAAKFYPTETHRLSMSRQSTLSFKLLHPAPGPGSLSDDDASSSLVLSCSIWILWTVAFNYKWEEEERKVKWSQKDKNIHDTRRNHR